MDKPGIHVFVICCVEYHTLVEYCIKSIKNIQDPILSINVISNAKISIQDVNIFLDHDIWDLLDPDKKYHKIYKANWTRQQVFKLTLDRLVSGNCLVVDAEILFLRDIYWIEKNKINLFTSNSPYYQPYFSFMTSALSLDRISQKSFISDTMLFNTDILQNIRHDIEENTDKPWLQTLQDLVIDKKDEYGLSEFEIYGNYLLKKYPEQIHSISHLGEHILLMDDRQSYPFDQLTALLTTHTDNPFISVNIKKHSYNSSESAWLTFYTSIRDPTWPDCYHEEDFLELPSHIQKECIEVFGYYPGRFIP